MRSELEIEDTAGTGQSVRVLTLSTVFPNPQEKNLGLFVRSRMREVARYCEVRVVAPIPLIDYGRLRTGMKAVGYIPKIIQDESFTVYHPRWFYLPMGGWLNGLFLFLCLLWPLWRIRKSYRFDVIDAHFAHPNGIAASLFSAFFHCPFTVTLRGNEPMHAQSWLRRILIARSVRRASRVIAVSENLRQFALSLQVKAGKTRTIPNGIDTEQFYPRPRDVSRERRQMPADKKIIASVGYLIERKGHHHAIRALRKIRDAGTDAMLWVVGGPGREGVFEQRIHALVRELELEEAVRFTGAVAHAVLPEILSAADVLCLASSREGWPNVAQEAIACGTPVVSTSVGGISDIIASPEYGIVVPPGDDDALEAALKRALQKRWDRNAISAWGRSRSWEKVGVETAGQLKEAAGVVRKT